MTRPLSTSSAIRATRMATPIGSASAKNAAFSMVKQSIRYVASGTVGHPQSVDNYRTEARFRKRSSASRSETRW